MSSSSNLEQSLDNNNSSAVPSSSPPIEKYGTYIEEFNANISFGNSIKWCRDENVIALLTNNSIYIKNVSNDKRGTIVLHNESESEDGTVTTSQEPNRTSTHFKDRTVIHPSMFVRFLSSCFRNISWSAPIENDENFEITNEIGCLICCSTSDNNCKIYKRPSQGFTTNWELVCDVRSLLLENDKILQSIEKDNDVTVSFAGLISNNVIDSTSDSSIPKKKTRTHVSKKNSTQMSFEQKFFAQFYKSFTEESGFDPSKEEYRVGYRKWTDEEQEIYDRVLKDSLNLFKPQMDEFQITKQDLTKNLYVKLRTKMRKDKEKGKLSDVLCNIYSPNDTTTTPLKVEEPTQTKDSDADEDEDESTQGEKKRKAPTSDSPQPKKPKRLYFSRGSARVKDEELEQHDYVHRLYLSEILCFDFSLPFKKQVGSNLKQSLYLVCGSKTGFLSVFSVANFDQKLEVELVGYTKGFSTFVSNLKFLPPRENEDFFRIVCTSADGQIKIFNLSKLDNPDDLVSLTLSSQDYSAYFEKDDIPVTSLETLYLPISKSKKAHDEMYICYSKGTNLFVCKFEFDNCEMVFKWRKKLSCQDFTISSISVQHISIDSPVDGNTVNYLFVYTTSLDGSVVQWKITDSTNDNYISVYIISKNCELPIWGCSLSPNNVQACISVERPPTREVRADLEHRNKMRIYIVPIYKHALRAIYQIPNNEPIPGKYIIDYFTTLISRGLTRRQQAFDIANCLLDIDMLDHVATILERVYEKANKERNLTLKKVVYFLYSRICSEMDHPLKDIFSTKKKLLEHELRYLYAITLFDIQSKKEQQPNLTQYLICDWVLLYYQYYIEKEYLSNQQPSINPQQIDEILSTLESITRELEREAEKNSVEIQFAQKLCTFFRHILTSPNDIAARANEIVGLNNFITLRDECPVCKPTSAERFVKMEFGANTSYTHSVCLSNRKHPIARDAFSFSLIRDIYEMLECSCCGEQTSRFGLLSLLYQNNANMMASLHSPSEVVVVPEDERLMTLWCPSHDNSTIETCSFKIECCLCGSSFNSKV